MSELKNEKRIIRFSPPDITDLEVEEVVAALNIRDNTLEALYNKDF